MNVLKNILKRALPKVLLKKAFGLYNLIKITTIDKVIFPEYKIEFEKFKVYRTGYPFRENHIDISDLSGTVKEYMNKWYDWTQEEFLLIFDRPCYIEPDFGWAIIPPNRLLYYSLGISRTWFQPKPSFIKLWKRRIVSDISVGISLRDSGEENYFHFYNDVLSKIFFLKNNSINIESTPLIISKKLWDKNYFQFYLKNSPKFQSLNWIVQDKQYIYCRSTIFCKPLTHRVDLYKLIFGGFNLMSHLMRRLYITRSRTRLRYIENGSELEDVLKKHKFEIIDPDTLTMEDQIKIFSEAAVIVGIHGAGLTNIYFRNNFCNILEIFPPPIEGYTPFHYIMLAKMKGFRYNALIGEKSNNRFSGGFYLSPELLESNLKLIV